MTREEAVGKINAIKKYLTAGNPIWDVREIDEALNMAIKALEQEPVVRCKDCKYWTKQNLCAQLSRFGSIEPLADFYCAFGERREP